ncbi:hypothetical protein GCM10023113_37390 [Cellulomonas oligotrophica]|uniref:Uncharacterized protein n=1 Tax=Cellulomonas oligotrophica TaxID=931536 RepID=A0ABQ4DEN1_9CELL|nr:hypothetical protein Col01nite_33360 [Cellulomonas oligotrophica]
MVTIRPDRVAAGQRCFPAAQPHRHARETPRFPGGSRLRPVPDPVQGGRVPAAGRDGPRGVRDARLATRRAPRRPAGTALASGPGPAVMEPDDGGTHLRATVAAACPAAGLEETQRWT